MGEIERMDTDYVSKVNLWCQKNDEALPAYEYINSNSNSNSKLEWTCVCNWSHNWFSSTQINKKMAKQDVAFQIYGKFCYGHSSSGQNGRDNQNGQDNQDNQDGAKLVPEIMVDKPTILLIDGDQRNDVIKWLCKFKIGPNLMINIYVSPCMNLQIDKEMFTIHVAKTTSRDSADAMILIDLGRHMYLANQEIIIVSSDHILVQAALDYSLKWAKNVQDLQRLLIK
ncbi:MAG: double-stranded RNA binding motif domain-containing protein [Candidatus Paceibacterota bacterium]